MARRSRVWRWLIKAVLRRHDSLKSFDQEVGDGLAARAEAGTHSVPVEKIVGSVGRARALRSDFFYRGRAQAMTYRYRRIGELMERGAVLPPIDLYKLKRQRADAESGPASEYYVLDGHHRVAMARKLGQAYLDASVVEYHVAEARDTQPDPGVPDRDAPADDAGIRARDPDETAHDA